MLAGRGQRFSLRDIVLQFVDERVSRVFGVNINKLDTYSVHVETIDIVRHNIPALEKLAELQSLLAEYSDVQITEELTQIAPQAGDGPTKDQRDYLMLYSLDQEDDSVSNSADAAGPRECKTQVTYVCAPDVKGLTVVFFQISSQ